VIIYDEGAKAYEQQIRKGSNLKGVARISDIDQMEAALGVRTIPYLISINYIKNRPIFGYGYSIHKQLKEKEGFLLAHSHNIGLDILLRTGFLGLFTFIAVILFFVKGAVNRVKEINSQQKTAVMLFLSLVYIIIINGFANSIANLATSCALWLCMGLVISAQNMTTFRQNGLKF
jgi:O-antigen ligase